MQRIPAPGEENYDLFYKTMYYARLLRAAGKIEQRVADLEYQLVLPQTAEERKKMEKDLMTEKIRLSIMGKKKERARSGICLIDLSTGA